MGNINDDEYKKILYQVHYYLEQYVENVIDTVGHEKAEECLEDFEEIIDVLEIPRWTQEEIDKINKEADELHKSLQQPNVPNDEVTK